MKEEAVVSVANSQFDDIEMSINFIKLRGKRVDTKDVDDVKVSQSEGYVHKRQGGWGG